ncbi:MAG: sensor histidine kinase [Pseudonocardia sp.]|nr:sensor histidine kinase [Pseudonocardia sp.]
MRAGDTTAEPELAPTPLHQALVYSSDQELVDAAVPFLRAGAAVAASVLVVLAPHKRDLVVAALNADPGYAPFGTAQVRWVDPVGWYTFPAHSLRRAAEFAAGHTPAWMLGEVVWAGRSAAEVREWARYEALINVALPDTPVFCVYDTRTLDPAVLVTAAHTHPVLRHGRGAPVLSDAFLDPVRLIARYDADALPVPSGPTRSIDFGGAPDLSAIRRFAARRADDAGIDGSRGADLVVAVNEAATNAIEHGDGRGTVRSWTDGDRLVVEVTTLGGPEIDAFAGHLPPDPRGRRGRGMWMIRQLTDLVEIRPEHPGNSVRMHMRT